MNDSGSGFGILIVLVFVGWLCWDIGHDNGFEQGAAHGYENGFDAGQQSIIEEELATCEYRLEEYQAALSEANDNIESAKYYAWESYEEMGDALDYLETVSEPW